MSEQAKLAFRLTTILGKHNQGEGLKPQELPQEFGVSEHTVQFDINDRLTFLPIEKNKGYDSLELRNLSLKDLQRFACLPGVEDIGGQTIENNSKTATSSSAAKSHNPTRSCHRALHVASRMIVRTFYKQMRMRSVPVFHGPHWGFALERRLG